MHQLLFFFQTSRPTQTLNLLVCQVKVSVPSIAYNNWLSCCGLPVYALVIIFLSFSVPLGAIRW